MIEILLATLHQTSREKNLYAFIGVTNARMHYPDMAPFIGVKPGFFTQFSPGSGVNRLAWIDFPRRKFQKDLSERIAVLPFENHLSAVQQRNNHHGPLMPDIFARCLYAIRQAHAVKAHIKKFPAIHLRALDPCFGKMRMAFRLIRFHVVFPYKERPGKRGVMCSKKSADAD